MGRLGVLAVLAAAAVGACSGGSDEADAAATAAANADAFRPQPGLYRITVDAGEMMGMADMGNAMFSEQTYCLTEQQAAGGFREALAQNPGGECSYEKFELAGSRIDAVLVCSVQGMTMRMEQKGTATPTSSDLDITMKMSLPGMGEQVTTANVKHERIGDCPQ
ncbi:DUF3617 family protein [Parerythrobacter aurantius]|uniref:DUF3617 domain-containing protein n=1 Tax=Parerythrobacter aurantius TaxID=3127706 RepID=UPI00324D39AD